MKSRSKFRVDFKKSNPKNYVLVFLLKCCFGERKSFMTFLEFVNNIKEDNKIEKILIDNMLDKNGDYIGK